ncbi:MAG: T9SS type A sorting domain-containing protein [Melioribacteraceae bacterium]|nr:T9SS type A sorting domain-containing protein [Melioribacteraceae bacterium]
MKKRYIIYLVVLLTISSTTNAQLIWEKSTIGKNIYALRMDPNGDLVIGGNIDYGVSESSLKDLYTLKISSNGDSLWSDAINNESVNDQDQGECVAVDADGNVYIAGYLQDAGGWWKRDWIVAKYDPDGNKLWQTTLNGTNDHEDKVLSITVDGDGNVYAAGEMRNTRDSETNLDIATAKFNSDGDTLWTRMYNNVDYFGESVKDIFLDKNGDIILTGNIVHTSHWFFGELNGILLLKYNAAGDLLMDSIYVEGADLSISTHTSEIDADGNIYIYGSDLDNSTTSGNPHALYKFSNEFALVYKSNFLPSEGSFAILPRNLSINSNGQAVLSFKGSTSTWPFEYKIFLVGFDDAGETAWTYTRDKAGQSDIPLGLVLDNNNYTYAAFKKIIVDSSTFLSTQFVEFVKYDPSGKVIWIWEKEGLKDGSGGNYKGILDMKVDENEIIYAGFETWEQTTNTDYITFVKLDTKIGVTSAGDEIDLRISDFRLSQNYPNPFNPTTTIQFELPTESNVSLKVFNMLGEEVALLVNDYKAAGNYNIEFNAEHLTSGLYFYTLQSESFISTKKMLLIK